MSDPIGRPTAAVMSPLAGPQWRPLLRRGAVNAVMCIAVGLAVYAAQRQHLGVSIAYSLCIGVPCWLFIDVSRILVARRLHAADPGSTPARYGWPGWRWMAVCVVGGVALAYPLGVQLARALTGHPVQPSSGSLPAYVSLLGLSLAVAVGASYFFYSANRVSSADAEAQAARRLATEHQLRLLQAQLEPHMLFNTLANLRALIALDPPAAQAMLDRLIAFLRASLSASRTEWHSLAAEFARLDDYLQLMQVRMGPRLQAHFELPADLAAEPVPPLLLQPLVENAIQHGLEPAVDGGRLEVSAARDDGGLKLVVRDTGVGLQSAPAGRHHTGFGLEQVRQRLAAVYGGRASLRLAAAGPGPGTVAEIHLPHTVRDGTADRPDR
ncbi:sensor histidine kinase [Caldimonas brevitalea]|uniref:Autolysin sensor kinase n=1 Tax=Caldimonas brevitalea TaxID=413882 RepID=A0A0G3BJS3_9BURK|nr:histidine kinase [Caldimonas brevitalea]AKJ28243.1 autolysin sensor kinase [Caldimonas brevitalea]